tara:strand:+ start:2107 stop:2748 length:642 start_codon:yes stop_codon:yes gene_type:complete
MIVKYDYKGEPIQTFRRNFKFREKYSGNEPISWETFASDFNKIRKHFETGRCRFYNDDERKVYVHSRKIVDHVEKYGEEPMEVCSSDWWALGDLVSFVQTTLEHRKSPVYYKYANHMGWSDVNPWEITMIVSEKTIEIKSMKATKDDSVKLKWVAGGFAGHCVNQRDQEWFIESDPEGARKRIRRRKDGYWYDKYNSRFIIDLEPHKFYDYNF